MAGVYSYLPLGFKVLENIKQIVREEMNAIGAQELIMSSLQKKEVWEKTNRWDDSVVDVWFKSLLKDGTEVGFGWSHEEPIVETVKQHLESYKDLPINVYQFQTKLRNELRAKSGIMRGREFVMKDMYSCSTDAEEHEKFYNQTIEAYKKVYDRLGLGKDTYVTFASGGAFTEFSHEFQTVCDVGEDVIYLHRGKNIAVNEEVLSDESLAKLDIKREDLEKVKSVEVGNIFNFGTQKSEKMNFTFADELGSKKYVHLGSYGIGITRAMGVIVEKFADAKGIIWPENVAPFKVHLLALGEKGGKAFIEAESLYKKLQSQNISILFDDRDLRAGEKFADADLIGIPHRVVISEQTIEKNVLEHKARSGDKPTHISKDELMKILTPTHV